MSVRRLYLDRGIGEVRGVVTLDDRPERLILRREGDDPRLMMMARLVARVASVEPALATAFLDLGKGAEAILPFKPDVKLVRGQTLEVEIRAEPRRGKLAIARLIGVGEGEPRLVAPPPEIADQLRHHARDTDLIEGPAARQVADEAEADVLEVLHPLPGGGLIAVEPTRALTAIDVDLGERKGADAKRVTRQANLQALQEAARLLRLKGIGGIVVVDLVGRGHDGNALMAAARAAFSPDNPGVAIGPVGRFGTMELSLPRRATPVIERLLGADGQVTDLTLAHRLIRRVQSEAAVQGGARIAAACHPAVAEAASGLAVLLTQRIGARFELRPDPAFARDRLDVSAA